MSRPSRLAAQLATWEDGWNGFLLSLCSVSIAPRKVSGRKQYSRPSVSFVNSTLGVLAALKAERRKYQRLAMSHQATCSGEPTPEAYDTRASPVCGGLMQGLGGCQVLPHTAQSMLLSWAASATLNTGLSFQCSRTPTHPSCRVVPGPQLQNLESHPPCH